MKTIIDAIISHTPITHPPPPWREEVDFGKSEVRVMLEGEDQWIRLFSYYSDELSFHKEEFIGLTEDEGHALFRVGSSNIWRRVIQEANSLTSH